MELSIMLDSPAWALWTLFLLSEESGTPIALGATLAGVICGRYMPRLTATGGLVIGLLVGGFGVFLYHKMYFVIVSEGVFIVPAVAVVFGICYWWNASKGRNVCG